MGGLRTNHTHHGKVIATQPPQVRTIFWYGNMQGEQFIFPHSLYVAYYTRNEGGHNIKYWLNRLHVAFSLVPFDLKNWEQPIYGLPLANTDVGNAICFYEWPACQTAQEFIEATVKQWWASPFQDYGDCFSHWLQTYGYGGRGSAGTHPWRERWKEATHQRNWQWMWEQELKQAPYCVNLKKLFGSNKTLTEETDWFPNLGIRVPEDMVRTLAEQKWRDAGCPDGSDEHFWFSAKEELLNQIKPEFQQA